MTDLRRELANSFMECCFQVEAVLCDNHSSAAVELVALDHRAKHHIRVLFKVFVDRQSVFSLPDMYPIRNIGHFGKRLALMLFQEDNIRGDFRACIVLESSVLTARKSDRADEVSLVSQHLASAFITLVKCACRGHECHDTTVFQLVESFRKEEIVQFRGIVNGITETKLTKRHIADSHIKAAILKTVLLKTLNCNIRIRIESLSNSAGQRVDLHAVELRVCLHIFGHTTEKVSDTHCRL